MKKAFFSMLAVIAIMFSACTKEEEIIVAPSVKATDTPPVEIFGNDIPYVTSMVYIHDTSAQNANYINNFTATYREYDQYDGHLILTSTYSQDWYTIRVPKYWGVYMGQSYSSESVDTYSISAETLAQVREMIKKRGGDCIARFYLSFDEPTGTHQSIGWVLPN